MIFIKQILLLAILTITFEYEVFSQSITNTRFKQPGFFFGIGLGTANAQIKNSGISSSFNLKNKVNYSVSEFVELGYYFSRYFGLTSGLNYYSYKTIFTLETYQDQLNTIDEENEAYELQISGTGIEEIQRISVLGIPICINFRMPLNKTTGFYLQSGVNLAFPIDRNYESTGTFSYKGYFPAYNVLLENLPEYGFESNVKSESTGPLELKPLIYNIIASAGFDYLVQKRFQISIAAYYDKSLSNISEYSSQDKFQLAPDIDQLNSFMFGSSKATLQAMGLKVSLRYYLTDFTKFKYYSKPSIKRNLKEYNRRYKGFVR